MGAEKSQHSAGWYAGALVFWLLSAWLITVGLSSIIPQIFLPGGDAHSDAGACAQTLRRLRRELFDHTSQTFARDAVYDRDRELAWFERWDRELARARPSCPTSEAASELSRLRHGTQTLVERFEREQASRLRRLDQLLGVDRRAGAPEQHSDARSGAPEQHPDVREAAPETTAGEQARAKPPRGEDEQP